MKIKVRKNGEWLELEENECLELIREDIRKNYPLATETWITVQAIAQLGEMKHNQEVVRKNMDGLKAYKKRMGIIKE